MRIGTNDNHLIIERTSDPDFPYYEISARLNVGRGVLSGSNDGVFYCGGAKGRCALRAYLELGVHEVSLDFTEDCWIKIVRHARGNLTVRFQISVGDTAMKGVIALDGEYSQGISSELRKLLAESEA